MERLRPTPENHARKITLIEKGMAEGAHEKVPQNITQEYWRRMVDIGLLYNIGSETVLQKVGEVYGLHRERIRQINKEFIVLFHGNCSEELQKEIPLETIPFAKPLPQSSREKKSEARGGKSLKIRDVILKKGMVSPKQLSSELEDISPSRIRTAARVLESWGLKLERSTIDWKKIEKQIEEEEEDGKLQQILDNLLEKSFAGIIRSERRKRGVFGLLGATLTELGFDRRQAKFIAERLKFKKEIGGIPLRSLKTPYKNIKKGKEYDQIYYVYCDKHEQRVIDVIKTLEAARPIFEGRKFEKVKRARNW